MAAVATSMLSPLVRAVVRQGQLVQADGNTSRPEAHKAGVSSVKRLLQPRKLTTTDLALFASAAFGAPPLDLRGFELEQLPTTRAATKLIGSQRVIQLLLDAINGGASNEQPTLRLNSCTRPIDIPQDTLPRAGFESDYLGGVRQACQSVDWHICKNSVHKGRLGIYQAALVSEEMTEIIMKCETSIDIADQAVCEAVRTLCWSGLEKAKVGPISLERWSQLPMNRLGVCALSSPRYLPRADKSSKE